MRVNVNELKEGCILEKEVFGMTSFPIIAKKTILSELHINVLKDFSIEEVHIERTLVNGDLFKPRNGTEEPNNQSSSTSRDGKEAQPEFIELYLKSIQEFKIEFTKWQSGGSVDIANIRSIVMPLLEKVIEDTDKLYEIHHYSSQEEYFYHHSIAVGLLSAVLAKKLGYEKGVYNQVALGGVLSDCGMSKISPTILFKKTTLLQREYEEIKQHTLNSYKMIKDTPLLKQEIKLAIYQHHERLDGTGYPAGEKIDKIHEISRIIAVADVYHAMTSQRVYRSKQSPFKVLEMIKEDSFGQFDISVVKSLLSIIGNLSIGTRVVLSNGEIGSVLFTKSDSLTRPLVKLEQNGDIVDLVKQRSLHIEDILH
ncbi:HD-GYP domain-containing protein [Falsibacillus albus]|uniref:HD-GYP domain-containing protein n=1 Tax=Falsibacillus albus TaxID=2478915 RepID=A0A3L7JUM6_9BACI|nr:HD-GYP domain-containing protein [Falsibacillus albus]RLQ93954.1 HD-GYP domain-containing protein [Falsibacillus albus]